MASGTIEARSVSYRFSSRRTLFEGLDLRLGPGEAVGLTGGNGEGKTTLLRLLAGLLPVQDGSVSLSGRPIRSWPLLERARVMAYLPQTELVPFPVTALEMALFGRYPHLAGWRVRERAEDLNEALGALEAAGISHLRDTPYEVLSGGERGRVRIARLLAQRAQILLLDEPTTHVDRDFREVLAGLLLRRREEGGSCVVISHDIVFLEKVCQRVLLLQGGKFHDLPK